MSKASHMTPTEAYELSQLDRIEVAQQRLETKLDVLLAALAEDVDEEGAQFDLDGNQIEGSERDANESLD